MLQEEADRKWFNDSKSVDVLTFLSPLSTIYGSSARQHCLKSLHQKSDKAVKNRSSPSAWFLCPVRFDAFNSSFDGEHLEMDEMDETDETDEMDQMGEMDGEKGFDLSQVFQKSDENSRGFESNPIASKSTAKSSQLILEPESWYKRRKRAERRRYLYSCIAQVDPVPNVLFGYATVFRVLQNAVFLLMQKVTAQPPAPQFATLWSCLSHWIFIYLGFLEGQASTCLDPLFD